MNSVLRTIGSKIIRAKGAIIVAIVVALILFLSAYLGHNAFFKNTPIESGAVDISRNTLEDKSSVPLVDKSTLASDIPRNTSKQEEGEYQGARQGDAARGTERVVTASQRRNHACNQDEQRHRLQREREDALQDETDQHEKALNDINNYVSEETVVDNELTNIMLQAENSRHQAAVAKTESHYQRLLQNTGC